MDRYGQDRFFAFRDAVLRDPAAYDTTMRHTFGAGFADVVAAFEKAVRDGSWPRG